MSGAGALHALHNAKAALDAQLITQSDFDQVKDAFLKAQVTQRFVKQRQHTQLTPPDACMLQQIRAGLDAGFILEQDYQAVKHAFMDSLQLSSARGVSSTLSERALQGLLHLGRQHSHTLVCTMHGLSKHLDIMDSQALIAVSYRN